MLLFLPAQAPGMPDSTRTNYSASVSLNSNGIASIPAFSLGKPAVIASITVQRGRFSYDPVLAYGPDMKPWFIDNWLRYKIIRRTNFELRAGFNFSNFFTQQNYSGEIVTKGERYFAGELAGFYRLGPKNVLSLMFWNDNGIEPGSISGNYLSLADEVTGIPLWWKLHFGAQVQVFYIGYDGSNDGFFVSPKLSFGLNDFPLSVFLQATQVLDSNIEPDPGFKWNIGINYIFD